MVVLRLQIRLSIVNTRIICNIHTLFQIMELALHQVIGLVGLAFEAMHVRTFPRFLVHILLLIRLRLNLDLLLQLGKFDETPLLLKLILQILNLKLGLEFLLQGSLLDL